MASIFDKENYVQGNGVRTTVGSEFTTPLGILSSKPESKNPVNTSLSFKTECEMTPEGIKPSVGAGLNIQPIENGPVFTAGVKTAISFGCDGQVGHSVVPTFNISQNVGKNTKIVANMQQYGNERVSLGVRFNI